MPSGVFYTNFVNRNALSVLFYSITPVVAPSAKVTPYFEGIAFKERAISIEKPQILNYHTRLVSGVDVTPSRALPSFHPICFGFYGLKK
jgi:hypothetical protein